MSSKLKSVPMLLAAALVVAYVIIDTRIGAFLVMDVVGGIGEEGTDYDARNGPLTLTAQLAPAMEITLPTDMDQPSGIQHRGDRVYISTDQAELFVLDGQFDAWIERVDLIGGPLLFKQGSLEGIEVVDDTVLAIGEFGAIWVWRRTDDAWERLADQPLPQDIAELEFSGITNLAGRRLATSEDTPVIVDVDSGTVHEIDFDRFLKAGADPASLQFSGLASENGRLYVLTESYTSILVIDPSDFSVLAVFGAEPGPAADLAVRDGRAYVVIDHNYNEPRPPLHVYDLPPR